MTIDRDNATLILENDVSGDGNTNTGKFEFTTDLEAQKEIRTSMLLDNSLDRVLGALNEALGADQSNKRSGITIDVGGGKSKHQFTFKEADGATGHQWGDGSGNDIVDATGDSARRKADVLERYIKTGTYGSWKPAKLKFGEYNDGGGVYEDTIPVAIESMRLTISAREDAVLEGTIKVFEVGTPGGQQGQKDSAVNRGFF